MRIRIFNGERIDVACAYHLAGNSVSFSFPDGYNADYPLIIDPEVIFATLSGGTSDNWGTTATNDNDGNLITGGLGFDPVNGATPYPITPGAFQETFGGSDNVTISGGTDMVFSKYSSDGSQLIFSTYLGGENNEFSHSINVTDNEDILILGTTSSPNFPTTSSAYQNTFSGGVSFNPNNIIAMLNGTDITVTRLSADGSQLIGSTYIGGTDNDGNNSSEPLNFNYSDEARGDILFGDNDEIIVLSCTVSTDFPVTTDAVQSDNNGNQDGVVCKFNSDLSQLLYGSYFGGSEDDGIYGAKVDSDGNLFVTGGTNSPNLPTNIYAYDSFYNGGQADGFIAKFDNNTNFQVCSYLGTDNYDQSFFVDFDSNDLVYVMGQSLGTWDITNNTYGATGGNQFIVQMDNDLSEVLLSSAFGTGGNQINISPTAFLVDECNKIYVSGWGGITNQGGNNTGNSTSIGSVLNMDITSNAYQSVTDGNDFYFMVLEENMADLSYGTYFGDPISREHVDGGTSRFDKSGVIYQAVCAGCGGNPFPTTVGAWSEDNPSPNCNVGAVKFAFEPELVVANFSTPDLNCDELTIDFTNLSYGSIAFEWDFGDGTESNEENPSHTYNEPGEYIVTLTAINNGTCNDEDVYEQLVTINTTPVINMTAPDNDFCFSEGSIAIEIINDDAVDISCFVESITNFDLVYDVDYEIVNTSETSTVYELDFLLFEELIPSDNILYVVYEFNCVSLN